MKLILKLALNAITLAVVAYILPGFGFSDVNALVVASIIMGVVNTFIKPVLQIIFLPLSIITFGITAFLINVVLLWGVSFIVPGFNIDGFLTAVLGSVALTLVSWFLNSLSKDKKED
jgi:putative membrane protein